MYLEQFRLKELPFRLSPDPEFLYLSKAHARAKAYMESTIWFADGFVVITGEIGCGKTTLIETFLKELQQDVVVAQVNQTQVSSIEFLQSVLVQFGFKPFRMKKAELLATLNDFLVEQYRAGRKLVLVVDEAQNLTSTVLEEVRLLSGIETTKEKVLRIILAGQPELNEKLDAPDLEQLAQRIRLRFHLPALSSSEMRNYILHRLEVAGSQGREIFTADCFDLIYRYTGGVPRLVNTLCDTALIAAATENRDVVARDDIMAVIEELQWSEYASRSGTRLMRVTPDDFAAAATGERRTPEAAPPALARILLASGGRTVAERTLAPGRLIIGRTAANDLQIESRFVSRHHCQIVTTQQSCVIEDLNSTNGIFLHSKRVRYHNLNDGDVITIGQHELLYIDERSLQRAPSEAPQAVESHPADAES
ncbi:MAG TPA: AAA family ATPase [Steroidobacteraceae bacterium]|jgi:general secretion pathway protein A|nr:AAA family ATPase [Steroidobacteraceae bacterium]